MSMILLNYLIINIYELDVNSQKFLKELFDNKIDSDEKIKSWKNKVNQKTDIFI